MIFKLFACCIPVLGAQRSIICDIQRGSFQFIPNKLYEILTEHKDKRVDSIKLAYSNKYDDYIDSYLSFLEENEFGFWCKNPEQFPDIELDWMHPSVITNAIIDIDSSSSHDYEKIAQELDQLGCQALNIRIYDRIEDDILLKIISFFDQSRLRSIELILKYSNINKQKNLHKLCQTHQRIRNVIVHSSPQYRKVEVYGVKIPIIYSPEKILDHSHCGVVDPSYFVVNTSCLTESLNFNNCLNKKISVDIKGEIKNCPSMSKSYGNISDITLIEALNIQGFKDLWDVTKDQIDICRDCEFRYICVDCRAFTQKNGILNKPEKCKYDPYIAKWVE